MPECMGGYADGITAMAIQQLTSTVLK